MSRLRQPRQSGADTVTFNGVRVPQDFQPSRKSLSPRDVALARIKYARRALDVAENSLVDGVEPPTWVLDRLTKAAQLLGMVVSYTAVADKKRKP